MADAKISALTEVAGTSTDQQPKALDWIAVADDGTDAGSAATRKISYREMIPWINVKEFGATGDGSTDDRAAIQAAIDAVSATVGGTVFFPVGVYKITSSLTVTGNNLHIIGESKHGHTGSDIGSAIKLSGMTGDVGLDFYNTDHQVKHNGPFISKMGFFDSDGASAGNRLVRISSFNRWTVDNCWFREAYIGLEPIDNGIPVDISVIATGNPTQRLTVTGHNFNTAIANSQSLRIVNSDSVPRIDGTYTAANVSVVDANTIDVTTGVNVTSAGTTGQAAIQTDAAWGTIASCNFKACRIAVHGAGNYTYAFGGDWASTDATHALTGTSTSEAYLTGTQVVVELDPSPEYFEYGDYVTITGATVDTNLNSVIQLPILQKISSTKFVVDCGVAITGSASETGTVRFHGIGLKLSSTQFKLGQVLFASTALGVVTVGSADISAIGTAFEDCLTGIISDPGAFGKTTTTSSIIGCTFSGSGTERGVWLRSGTNSSCLIGNHYSNIGTAYTDLGTKSIRLDGAAWQLQDSTTPVITVKDDNSTIRRQLDFDAQGVNVKPIGGSANSAYINLSGWDGAAATNNYQLYAVHGDNSFRLSNTTQGDRFLDLRSDGNMYLCNVGGGFPILPTFAVGSLPTGVAGGIIYVTGTSQGNSLCFYDGSSWVDVETGAAVTA